MTKLALHSGYGVRPKRRSYQLLDGEAARALQRLEAQHGGRQALIAMLVFAPKSDPLDTFLAQLVDPRADQLPLAHLCDAAGVWPRDLLKWLEQAQLAEARAKAAQQVAQDTPRVAADVMRRAQVHQTLCPDCKGEGHQYRLVQPTQLNEEGEPVPTGDPYLAKVPCAYCGQSGYVASEPHGPAVDQALEMAGLLAKSGGLSITQQQLVIGAGPAASLPALQSAIDQILYGDAFAPVDDQDAGVVEGTVVPPVVVPPTAPTAPPVTASSSDTEIIL